MKICAHTLVKNEGRWLWFSVNSIINYVDKLLLWDSGSEDESPAIEKELLKRFPKKIELVKRTQRDINDFTTIRQEMLDATSSDWILIVDGDEIWWLDTIRYLVSEIKNSDNSTESFIVPTINAVGDIFHYQDESAGRYRFGSRIGHYNLRAINNSIPGLHSQGVHGVWGWADNENKMIQDRGEAKIRFVNSPYLHTTFLPRSSASMGDANVIKRSKKLKYEFGKNFPRDFIYPEVFFIDRPTFVLSPWSTMGTRYKFRAFFETPVRRIKRQLFKNKIGY